MGKRSNFPRSKNDLYQTPMDAVLPLLPFLPPGTRYDEPCCGHMALVRALSAHGHICVEATDSGEGDRRGDAMDITKCAGQMFITNPPWTRKVLHPMIMHLSDMAPTWMLLDADWAHTKQATPYLERCRHIVAVGRVKWFNDQAGKDNACWYGFDKKSIGTQFWGRK